GADEVAAEEIRIDGQRTAGARESAGPGGTEMIRILVRAAAIFALALAIAFGQTPPAPRVVGGFNVNGASLLEVIDSLAKELHIHYILDSTVKGGTVTVNTYGAPQDVD